jgi:hypothetical protein
MDPNANLQEQLRLAERIVEDGESGMGASTLHADRLAELVLALNEWISNGGFLPEAWRKK